jgi:hypothetical protein
MSWKTFNTHFSDLKRLSYGYFGDTYIQDNTVYKVMYNCKRSREEIEIMHTVSNSRSLFLSTIHASYLCRDAVFFGYKKLGVFKCWNNWEKVKKGNGIIIAMEYSGIPLVDHIQLHAFNKRLLLMMIYSLYIFRKTTHMHHNDTWLTNFTVKTIKTQDITFDVNGITFMIPRVKFVPVLIDYGKAEKNRTSDSETDISILLDDSYKYTNKKFILDITQYVNTTRVIHKHFDEFRVHPK